MFAQSLSTCLVRLRKISMRDLCQFASALLLAVIGFTASAAENSESYTKEMLGKYSCSFISESNLGRYEYPSFQCVIKNKGNDLWLEKLSGSQRIRGAITATQAGFDFEGEFFCPYGDCSSRAFASFTRLRPSPYTQLSFPSRNLNLCL